MKFPGRRKTKHYFPVEQRGREPLKDEFTSSVYIVGFTQPIVDIEIQVESDFFEKENIPRGESLIISDERADYFYDMYKAQNKIRGEYPGGTIANTLHNFAILSDSPSIALGAINQNISVGDYAFHYISKTSSKVDMSYLQPSDKPMGRALVFICPEGERTFAISKGCMNDLDSEFIPSQVIEDSAALVISAYLLRDEKSPIFESTIKACERAKAANVPVVLTLGTSQLVKEKREYLFDFCRDYVSVLAMNDEEAYALTGRDDSLLAGEMMLEFIDMALITVGPKGLYLCAHVDRDKARKTKESLHTKSIVDYNEFEYSRAMRREDCKSPMKIYSHINPYMGGPMSIRNTNGAGDAALAAILHDLTANIYHKRLVPNSPKHDAKYLTYSSLSQICKYANRVSYEVLNQNSPRLAKGLPQREDALEEAHWEN
jgi:inosine kinase